MHWFFSLIKVHLIKIFRFLLAKDWAKKLLTERNIPFTRGLNVTEYLTDVTIVGEWKLQGLPNDELSIQNAIIVTRAKRYPLLIDPQGARQQLG